MPNLFKRLISANVGTSLTSVGDYTVPSDNVATVIGLSVSNITAADRAIDIVLSNSTTNAYVIKNASVPANATIVTVGGDQKIVMEPGDSIKVKTDTASGVDAILSVLQSTQ